MPLKRREYHRKKRISRQEKMIKNYVAKMRKLIGEVIPGAQLLYKFALFKFEESVQRYYPHLYMKRDYFYYNLKKECKLLSKGETLNG
jgi:hypothetical protein